MKIIIITPAAARSKSGNRNTAQRWALLLRNLGHRVAVQVNWDGSPTGLMIALHARKSHESLKRFVTAHPELPLVLALTGTDLYLDVKTNKQAQESMRLATRMIVLQDMALNELTPGLRKKTRVIYQSAKTSQPLPPLKSRFEVCVIGHLREEKDPFRCVLASQYLPADSRIHVIHMGHAMSSDMRYQAQAWMANEPRYRWLGEIPHWRVRKRLTRSRLMVISSRMEGGANVVSEAFAANVPVIASHISGNIGMLGKDYAGYYPMEDERALARILSRAETEPEFYRLLKKQCADRKRLISERREREGLRRLLEEIASGH